jgi:hypothetical protein
MVGFRFSIRLVLGPNGVVLGASVNQYVTALLYVGYLDVNIMDLRLYDLFNQAGQVVSGGSAGS